MTSTLESGHEERLKKRLKRRRPQWQPPQINPALLPTHPEQRLLTFHQWCYLNGFSGKHRPAHRCARRRAGDPQFSKQKIGITVAANRRWQASRARKRG